MTATSTISFTKKGSLESLQVWKKVALLVIAYPVLGQWLILIAFVGIPRRRQYEREGTVVTASLINEERKWNPPSDSADSGHWSYKATFQYSIDHVNTGDDDDPDSVSQEDCHYEFKATSPNPWTENFYQIVLLLPEAPNRPAFESDLAKGHGCLPLIATGQTLLGLCNIFIAQVLLMGRLIYGNWWESWQKTLYTILPIGTVVGIVSFFVFRHYGLISVGPMGVIRYIARRRRPHSLPVPPQD